jgi:purine-binding chemotaxis protein CheW
VPRKTKRAEVIIAEEQTADTAAAAVDVAAPIAPDEESELTADALTAVQLQAVTFRLESQIYGLPLEVVQEIQQLVEYTPLPDSAPALVGLIDLRGLVVPAIDLRVLVGLPQRDFTLETPMVFCRVREHVVCLIVDSVEDVVDLPAEGLQPPSNLYSMADRMLGMCRLAQGLVLMLDIDRLVPDAALAAADAVEGGRS